MGHVELITNCVTVKMNMEDSRNCYNPQSMVFCVSWFVFAAVLSVPHRHITVMHNTMSVI